jgi:hypothetical protein
VVVIGVTVTELPVNGGVPAYRLTLSAFFTLQLRVDDCPSVIVAGLAVKLSMVGFGGVGLPPPPPPVQASRLPRTKASRGVQIAAFRTRDRPPIPVAGRAFLANMVILLAAQQTGVVRVGGGGFFRAFAVSPGSRCSLEKA